MVPTNKETAKDAAAGKRSAKLSPALITVGDPKAPASEAYRSLRTNLAYAGIDSRIRSVTVTSPGSTEGKSTTCANLAIVLAQAGKRVLLLDADLRKPKIHKLFSLQNAVGMTDILVKDVPFEEVLMTLPKLPNLQVIPSGFIPPNPVEILESQKMAQMLEELQERYDMVIIDTPPVGQLTDAAVVGKRTDGVILVLASGETNIEMAKHARTNLDYAGAKVLGVVLTKIDPKIGGAYYYRYHNYSRYYEAE